MHKGKLALIGVAVGLLLAGCGNLDSSSFNQTGSNTTSKSNYQSTGQITTSLYDAVIQNGKYKTSQSRGLNLSQSTSTYNLKSFESGLLGLSQQEFPTKEYLFQEGQILKYATTKEWLSRVSDDNPDGLNPKDNGATEPDKRAPIYLQQLIEQDYMTQKGDTPELAGISVGLGMNAVDYYQKEAYGATFETEISDAKMEEEGKKMANTVIARLRKQDGVGDKPILIALYKQAPQDSLVGGTFFAYAVSKNGSTSVTDWKTVKESNYVFPSTTEVPEEATNDNSDFKNFKDQVQNFFPNLSGITAQAHYIDGALAGLNINVQTQFYGETEIMSFTQYIATQADKYLSKNVPIEINISSTQGMQAFVSRNANDKGFYTHVFGSY